MIEAKPTENTPDPRTQVNQKVFTAALAEPVPLVAGVGVAIADMLDIGAQLKQTIQRHAPTDGSLAAWIELYPAVERLQQNYKLADRLIQTQLRLKADPSPPAGGGSEEIAT